VTPAVVVVSASVVVVGASVVVVTGIPELPTESSLRSSAVFRPFVAE
jgi:hypothetical protein